MQEVDKLKEALVRIVMSGIIFLSSYFIIIELISRSDFAYHSEVAKNFSWSNIKNELLNGNTYFMWSSLVSFVFHHCKATIEGASAVVTAGANVLTLNIVWEYFKKKIPQIHDTVLLFFAVDF